MNCPHCSARIEPGITFCGVCGAPLTPGARAPAPARRTGGGVAWWWTIVAALLAAAATFGVIALVSNDDGTPTAATTLPFDAAVTTTTAAVTQTTAAAVSTTTTTAARPEIGRLDVVRARGKLICGIRDDLPGWGFAEEDGTYSGFDVDFCRVVAAGVLGDPEAVEFVPLSADVRFWALQSGEIDVLIRNTAWTATRDGQGSVRFLYPTFYDGQGFMVPAAGGRTVIDDLAGATICLPAGTTIELELDRAFEARRIPYTAIVYDDDALLRAAYEAGDCDAWTSDVSVLAQVKDTIESEGGVPQHIMAETISREPVGPMVLDGDETWAQAVQWSVMATVLAWEYGLDGAGVADYAGDDPLITLFLGLSDFDPGLGLATDFAATIVAGVGNYREIFDRNLFPIGLHLEGSSNALWRDGGLMYAPPYR